MVHRRAAAADLLAGGGKPDSRVARARASTATSRRCVAASLVVIGDLPDQFSPGAALFGDMRRGRPARDARRTDQRRRRRARARARAPHDRRVRPVAEGHAIRPTSCSRSRATCRCCCCRAGSIPLRRPHTPPRWRRISLQPTHRRARLRPHRLAARVRAETDRGVRRRSGLRDVAAVVHRLPRALAAAAGVARPPGAAVMIDVDGLQKAFGKKREVEAVRGVTFAAPDGEITGLLGPNGAGKTTTAADDCDARAAGRRTRARGRPRRRCRPVCRSRPHRRAVGCARPLSAADGARERRATSVDCTDSRAQRSKRGSTRCSRRSAWHRLPIGAPRDSRRASG